jgi:ribonuclease G
VSGALLLSCSPGEVWAALVQDGALAGLRVLRAATAARSGEVLLGRVVALKPELPAALVDIGLDRPGFLSAEDAAPGTGIAGLHEGQALIVQVTKEARADKATGLTLRVRLEGRHVALTPGREGIAADPGLDPEEARKMTVALAALARPKEGFRLHKAAAGASASALAEEAEALRRRWQAIEAASRAGKPPLPLEAHVTPVVLALAEFAAARPDEIVIDDRAALGEARRWLALHAPALTERVSHYRETVPLFEERGVAGGIEAALTPRVALALGGALAIEETAAATMIDVDLGSGVGRRGAAERAALTTNLAAAEEVARQIRLRNLAGPIVVDFIGMRRREQRERVRAALVTALAGDAEVLGWTRLGHLELVRKRRAAPLASLLYERAPGGGLVKTALTVALEALRALAREAARTPPRAAVLRLNPDVAAALDGPARAARQELEQRLGRPIEARGEPGRAREAFDIALN